MCANIVTGHATDDDDDAPLVMAPGSVFQAIIPPIILISDKLLLGERERRSFHHGNDVLFVAAFVESWDYNVELRTVLEEQLIWILWPLYPSTVVQ